MRYEILGFNQRKAIEFGLTMQDLMLLHYIMISNGDPTLEHTEFNGISHVWIQHKKITQDYPILNISEGTIKNKLVELKKKDLISSVVHQNPNNTGSKAYYAVTLKTMSMIKDDIELPEEDDDSRRHSGVTSYRRHSDVTSVNKQIDNNIFSQDISNDISFKNSGEAGVTTNGESITETKQYTKDDFLGSAKKRKKPAKKSSLYTKCMDETEAYCFSGTNGDMKLFEVLQQYLSIRLAMKDKPIYGVAQWKSLLVKLEETAQSNKQDRLEIVKQSLEHGWASFYPVQQNNKSSYANRQEQKFSEYGAVSCERAREEDILDVEY